MTWEIHTAAQTLTFLWSLLLGAVLCGWYDLFRLWRRQARCGVITVFFQDILFWTVSAAVTFLFLLARENGAVRWYVLFGTAIGFLLWRRTVGAILFRLADRVSGVFRKVFSAIFSPFAKIFGIGFSFWRKKMTIYLKKYKNMGFRRKNS